MRRGRKIAVAAVALIAVLLTVNTLLTDRETRSAEVTVPGGKILHLARGDLQVVEKGPRNGSPIVLIHCFTCAIDWWDGVMPLLDREHRVIAVDLLGHGGSEKPSSGYSIPNQADVVAEALDRLGVRQAEVVGHSLGGAVATALAERTPGVVSRIVIIDSRSSHHDTGDLGLLAKLAFTPVVGEALWRVKPDFSVRKGLEVAFAPGFDVPDAFVADVNRMTYTAYDSAAADDDGYIEEKTLAERISATGRPLMVLMGAEEQIINDPRAALAAYRDSVPSARTVLVQGAGHSPNVEKPAETAALLLGFDRGNSGTPSQGRKSGHLRHAVQEPLQNQGAVR